MYFLKQEASRLLFPCPPLSILLLGPSFQKPDLYSITHGPQMLLFSFPRSMGVGVGAPSTEMPVPRAGWFAPTLQGGHLSFPKHLENTALFGLETVVGAG